MIFSILFMNSNSLDELFGSVLSFVQFLLQLVYTHFGGFVQNFHLLHTFFDFFDRYLLAMIT